MSLVVDIHFEAGPPPPPEPEQRESTLDALVEQRGEPDQATPPIGFGRTA